MITTLKEYLQQTDIAPPVKINEVRIAERGFINEITSKIICFEAHLSPELFNEVGLKPFLNGFTQMFQIPIRLSYRMFDSAEGLGFYTKYPTGNLFFDPEAFSTPVFIFSVHSTPGRPETTLGQMTSEQLLSAFTGGFDLYPNIFFFNSCSLFGGLEGAKLAENLLKITGTRAIVGYTRDIPWDGAAVVLLLFLTRFFSSYDSFRNLEAIFRSVVKAYKPASTEMGFSLFLNPQFYPKD